MISGTMICGTMLCRASSGPCAPPVGVALQVGSGFSGECVSHRKIAALRRYRDRRACRSPELSRPWHSFHDCRPAACRRKSSWTARSIFLAIQCLQRERQRRAAAPRGNNSGCSQPIGAGPRFLRATPSLSKTFFSGAGQCSLRSPPESPAEKDLAGNPDNKDKNKDQDKVGGIRLPRAHLYLLFVAAATISSY